MLSKAAGGVQGVRRSGNSLMTLLDRMMMALSALTLVRRYHKDERTIAGYLLESLFLLLSLVNAIWYDWYERGA